MSQPVVNEKNDTKCLTNWEAFEQAQLAPAEIACWSYGPVHRVDISCKAKLPFDVGTIVRHMDPDHSTGGFYAILKETGKKTSFWKDLKAAGVECQDFRCDVCEKEVPLVARRIVRHMSAHLGKNRRIEQGGKFNLTLSFEPPMEGDDEEL